MLYLNLILIRLKTEEMNMQPVLLFFTILCLLNDSVSWGFKLALFPTSNENLTVEMPQIPEDVIAHESFIDDVIVPAINNGDDNANRADGSRPSPVTEHTISRNFRGQHEVVKKNAPKIIKLLSTSDVRVKRSTAFESTRGAEMMQDSAVTMTSDSSTRRSSDFTETPGLSQNQNNSESNQNDCPLRIYTAGSGVITGNKIYGLLKKPCPDNKPSEHDQDYVRHILQRIQEFLAKSVHFTSQLLSKISEIIRNDSLIEKLKQEDFKCYASENMLENETTAENLTVELHTSLLKSYALLNLAIKKRCQNETVRYDNICGDVQQLRKSVKGLLCGIENFSVLKGIDIVDFPLYSSPDDDGFQHLSFELYMYLHVNQVYNFLRDFSSNETWSKLWSL